MYAENAQLLSCNKHTSYLINEKKRAVWQEITDAVNTHTSVKRTRKSVKKKWMELKRQTIILSSQRKKSRAEGDVPPAEPWYVNYILDIVGDKNPVLEGVDGWCPPAPSSLSLSLSASSSPSQTFHSFIFRDVMPMLSFLILTQ